MADDADRRTRLRSVIAEYLQQHPDAGDTADGIVACWLDPTGYEDAPDYIKGVIDTMVAAGELVARELPSGGVLYLRGPALALRS